MNTKTTIISQAQLDAQFAFCDKISAYWLQEGRTPTAYVETYGCQQNEADSEKLRGYLAQSGYTIVHEAEGADVVVMNTCAIRHRRFSCAAVWPARPRFLTGSKKAIPMWMDVFPPTSVAVPGDFVECAKQGKAAILH